LKGVGEWGKGGAEGRSVFYLGGLNKVVEDGGGEERVEEGVGQLIGLGKRTGSVGASWRKITEEGGGASGRLACGGKWFERGEVGRGEGEPLSCFGSPGSRNWPHNGPFQGEKKSFSDFPEEVAIWVGPVNSKNSLQAIGAHWE